MKLSELIKNEGLEKVIVKTNISEPNLRALENEEFTKLNRVKALGFLVILEREYPEIDIEDIRERIKEHFEDNITLDENVLVLSRESMVNDRGFPLFKWFVILVLLSGGWYLYNEGELDGLLNNIQEKEEFFDDQKALENNLSEEDAEKVVVEESEGATVKIETPEAPKVEKSIVLTTVDSNDRNDTTNEVKTPVTTIQSVVSPVSETQEVNKTVITKIAKTAREITSDASLQLQQKEGDSVDENATAVEINTITINPTRGMLWFGFINIDTKKRKEFMKKVSTPFDIKGGRFLLVTGHGFLDIVSELKTIEVADRNKHYFYIDSKEIRELTKKEFRNMNGRHGW